LNSVLSFPSDPLTQDEKVMTEKLQNLVKTKNVGGVSALMDTLMEDFGGPYKQKLRSYHDTFATMVSSFKEIPTDAEKAVIIKNVADLKQKAYDVAGSQVGLEDAINNQDLKKKSENREFYQVVDLTSMMSKTINADPALGYKLITVNATDMASSYAHNMIVIEDFIRRYRTGKRLMLNSL
jgi:hypothetical protein